MIEYIKRDDAIHALLSPSITTDAVAIMNIATALIRIPVADVRENVHGEWVEETDRHLHWHCSHCGYVIGVLKMDSDYCPHCGSQMNGGNEK